MFFAACRKRHRATDYIEIFLSLRRVADSRMGTSRIQLHLKILKIPGGTAGKITAETVSPKIIPLNFCILLSNQITFLFRLFQKSRIGNAESIGNLQNRIDGRIAVSFLNFRQNSFTDF